MTRNLRTVIAALYVPATQDQSADRVICILHGGSEAADVTLPETQAGCVVAHLPRHLARGRPRPGTGVRGRRNDRCCTALCRRFRGAIRRTHSISQSSRRKRCARSARQAGECGRHRARTGMTSRETLHIVPPETKVALLADMGLPAAAAARRGTASLAWLTITIAARFRGASLSAKAKPLEFRSPLIHGPAPTALQIQREDGSDSFIPLGPAISNLRPFTALDGRAIEAAIAKLPPQPLGRHRIILDHRPEIVCRLTVAPGRCYLPERSHLRQEGDRHRGTALLPAPDRRPRHRGFHDAARLRRDGWTSRLHHGGTQSSARLCFTPTANAPALITLRPAVSSIRSISMLRASRRCSAVAAAPRPRQAREPPRRALVNPMSITLRSGREARRSGRRFRRLRGPRNPGPRL